MIAIILAASDDVKAAAVRAGFREQTVLVRCDAVMSTPDNKAKIETELFAMGPFQFLVSDFWGAGHG